MKIIGERLRSLRESVRLSQAKLAKEFDVSQSALARYEIDDSTPSLEVFLKYADCFDVSLDYIFGRTDDPHGMIYNNSSPRSPEAAKRLELERFGLPNKPSGIPASAWTMVRNREKAMRNTGAARRAGSVRRKETSRQVYFTIRAWCG